MRKRLVALIGDHPPFVTGVLVVSLALFTAVQEVWDGVPDLRRFGASSDAPGIYIQFAAVSAMVAGFAGVVLVFAMSPGWKRFARMRVKGRDRLEASWMSPVINAFVSAFISSAAAVVALQDHRVLAVLMFELAALLTAHAALRQTWLLRKLMIAVRRSDEDDLRDDGAVDVADL